MTVGGSTRHGLTDTTAMAMTRAWIESRYGSRPPVPQVNQVAQLTRTAPIAASGTTAATLGQSMASRVDVSTSA
jgi:hypothetical protein